MNNVNPNMLVLARESRGLTQRQLAERLLIPQSALSKLEHGLSEPQPELVTKFAEELNYPTKLFYEQGYIDPAFSFQYRKRQALSQKDNSRIQAISNFYKFHIQKLLQSVEVTSPPLPNFTVEEYGSIESVVDALRKAWRIPVGPIGNLTKCIEDAGIFIIHNDFRASLFDGATVMTRGIAPPIIFVDTDVAADRLRFTLAHELGHIIMHSLIPSANIEEEANQFAAELLLPKKQILSSLRNLSFEKLPDLKRHWKVSMAAIIKRAKDLGTITDRQYRYMWVQMAQAGYRVREPIELPKELPTLLKELIDLHKEQLQYSDESLADLLSLSLEEFEEQYLGKKQVLRLIPSAHKRIQFPNRK